MRVKKDSKVSAVAGAVAGIVRDGAATELEAIGVDSIIVAVKAITLATTFLVRDGMGLSTEMKTEVKSVDGADKTAFIFSVTGRRKN